jgi:V8-like Glu-specific endopeptidase
MNARDARHAPRVGALFERDQGGDHFCTASVVASPGKDLLITAAHCIDSGQGGGYRNDIAFVPGYKDGETPYGVWTPRKLIVDSRWASSSDPDLDVGFVVLSSLDGAKVQDVLGGNELGIDTGYQHLVRVIGYPASAEAPISCVNWTTKQADYQMRFQCNGYTGGTSGSPWLTDFNPETRTGTIVGVLGGYQEGGATDSVSYSSYLDDDIKNLYDKAVADG